MAGAASVAAEPLRIVIDAQPAHLNPILDPDIWGYRIAHDLICEPLWRPIPGTGADLATPAAYQGVLAESFHLDDDHAGVAVVLRKGVRFHDGRALTARDVRFTLEHLQESGRAAPRTRALVADLYRVEVTSDVRLHVLFRRQNGRLLQDLAEVDILPEHLFSQGSLAHQPNNRRPVCSGPYRLTEWRRAPKQQKTRGPVEELVLTRDPAYWGEAPPADELRFLVVPDAARGLAMMHRGEADILGRLPPLYTPEQVDPTALRGRLRPIEVLADQVMLLLWNRRNPALAVAKVRRGLSQLLDREKLVREVRHGLGEPLTLPPSLGLNPGPVTFDEAAATALLDEAGVTRMSEGGPRAYHGRPLRFKVLVPSGSSEALAVYRRLNEALGRAGIAAEATAEDLGTLHARLQKGDFDSALVAWAWTGPTPDLSRLLRSTSSQVPLGAESPDLDQALDALHRASEPATRAAALSRITPLLNELEPVTFLYRPRQLLLVDRHIRPDELPRSGDFLRLRSIYLAEPISPKTSPRDGE